MKKLAFILPLLALLFISFACSKDEDPSTDISDGGTISAKFNGDLKESKFGNSVIIDIVPDEPGGESLLISGPVEINTAPEFIMVGISLPIGQTLEVMTYQFEGSNCMSEIDICGSVNLTKTTTETGNGEDEDRKATITISSLDYKAGGHARGTFSGQYRDVMTGELVVVTEGKFHVPITL